MKQGVAGTATSGEYPNYQFLKNCNYWVLEADNFTLRREEIYAEIHSQGNVGQYTKVYKQNTKWIFSDVLISNSTIFLPLYLQIHTYMYMKMHIYVIFKIK